MGKGGVLWGRLVMTNRNTHHDIHWTNRTIYRRKVTYFFTNENARGFSCRDCVCIPGIQRLDLAFSRDCIRRAAQKIGSIFVARRKRDGIETNSVFSIATSRARQTGEDSLARKSSSFVRHWETGFYSWRWRSPRSTGSNKVDRAVRKEIAKLPRHNEASKNMIDKISFAEQGRSVCKGRNATDGTQTLHEIFAATAAIDESGTTLSSEGICTDARYWTISALDSCPCRELFLKLVEH